ncbi:hypothetical protein F3Y22_tig00110388pilonHSYRG00225 [Hibiscus syriacus]|uniref:KIB1-4 beta-propeller domain-containing protein n=1 Tax=Hibiscus syriacus TaxID=106335 RepID=A0A6A3AS70_HIBSY|nr:hypothetical protein F3Y22_tig00110388pilonHSYRG00225 [Hibiscus syriacus]
MERPDSKRWKLEAHGPNWSDLPHDIIEHIISRLHWVDGFEQFARPGHFLIVKGECRLHDALSPEYITEESMRGKEFKFFIKARPCASSYGWVLFEEATSLFLYSPFTTEVIKMPEFGKSHIFELVTFSLNAASPKCVVFLLRTGWSRIFVNLCSIGDYSWKSFEFHNGFDEGNYAVDATYADGVFYSVFSQGQLGVFNVELEEWTIVVNQALPGFSFWNAKLIASNADLLLASSSDTFKLLKLDFSIMRWVYESNLNNQVLFIGCTSFCAPAMAETSRLTNTIFTCCELHLRPLVRFYGLASHGRRLRGVVSEMCSEIDLRNGLD